ncbi:hypothetical protein C7M71_012595 [Peterkaempfera bronchialis]|uniref:Uncharacterized protein n=1 Tax=Peterkaempfera bronchialis TaxID=2126346 RepID=A0A345SWQ1_9ACTN|nr:hypothetical protein C7M71_012595 [Peterkaempfera bronchialis]
MHAAATATARNAMPFPGDRLGPEGGRVVMYMSPPAWFVCEPLEALASWRCQGFGLLGWVTWW